MTSQLAVRSRTVVSVWVALVRAIQLFCTDLFLSYPKVRYGIVAWLLTKIVRKVVNANWARGQVKAARLHSVNSALSLASLDTDDSSNDDEGLPITEKTSSPYASYEDLAEGGDRWALANCEALVGLEKGHRNFLLERAKVLSFGSGETIFEAGSPRDAFFVVSTGQVLMKVPLSGIQVEASNLNHSEYVLGPGCSAAGLLFVFASMDSQGCEGLAPESCRFHCSTACAGNGGATVVALPTTALREAFDVFPQAMASIVQQLGARFSTVVLKTLSTYFGLQQEFIALPTRPESETHERSSLTKCPPAEVIAQLFFGQEWENEKELSSVFDTATVLEYGEGRFALDPHQRASHLLVLLEGRLLAEFSSPTANATPDVDAHCRGMDMPDKLPLVSVASAPKALLIAPGGMVGEISFFIDGPSPLVYRCETHCRFAALPRQAMQRLMKLRPKACCLRMLHSFAHKLPGWLHRVDGVLDWVHIDGGRSLYRSGDSMRGFFVILSGKLIVLDESEDASSRDAQTGGIPVKDSLQRGRLCGEIDFLQSRPKYSATARACRDTEVCRVSPTLLHLLAMDFPRAMLRFCAQIAREGQKPAGKIQDRVTIAVVPANMSVAANEVCRRLTAALNQLGKTRHVSPNVAGLTKGPRVARALAELEERYRWIVYEAEPTVTDWTRRCIRQADLILVAMNFDGSSDGDVALSNVEKYIKSRPPRGLQVECQLLLLHGPSAQGIEAETFSAAQTMPVIAPDRSWQSTASLRTHFEVKEQNLSFSDLRRPGLRGLVQHLGRGLFAKGNHLRSTRHYLSQRSWVKRWHHVRMDETKDWARCGRLLVGQGIGLCLGGGGARGNGHFGVIKAMTELGIPIDAISGTSFGALVAGIYAMTSTEPGSMMPVASHVMSKTFSTRGMLMDFNFPRTAYFTGSFLNWVLQNTFARRRCEDMLIPFVCTSTDILNFKAKSHHEGPLWHVIRASMSLVGFVPPLPHQERDAENGRVRSCLLVDGGYTNQYPTEDLRHLGAGTVISARACPDFDPVSTDYGDRVKGGAILLLRLLGIKWRWFEGPDPPPQSEIQERLMFLPDTMLSDVSSRSDLHLKVPIDGFGLLEFSRFQELEKVGYGAALPSLKEWLAGDSEGALRVRNIIEKESQGV